MSDDIIRIPQDRLDAVCRHMKTREWWYAYREVLRNSWPVYKLNVLTLECEQMGIVRLGFCMPRDGAEDLAKDCDELIIKREKRWAKKSQSH